MNQRERDIVQVIDCSHPLSESVPVWPGDPPVQIQPWTKLQDGFRMNRISMAEHSGTHIGVPAHYVSNAITLDQLPVADLIRPAVCVHAVQYPEFYKGFQLTADMVRDWEQKHNRIKAESVVLVHTGWDQYWEFTCMGTGQKPMLPGIAADAAELFVEREIHGVGMDAPDIGAGDADFIVNRYLAEHDVFHLENLTRLNLLTDKEFTLIIGAVAVKGGTGVPCRVLAVSTLA
ncbi:MAG: cyclase family protein [candidate division KSB1 bacterium]|nr:cyclase family protein [candidate division KSB1 bacterium]